MARSLVALLVVAAGTWCDCRDRRIPNRLVTAGIAAGLALGLFTGGVHGLVESALGLLTGAAILFVPFALGWVGAGDVKLLAAIGAILGPRGVAYSILYGAVAGGVMSAIVLVRRRRLGMTLNAIAVGLVGFIVYVIPGLIGRTRGVVRPFEGAAHVPHSGAAIPYSAAIGIGLVIAIATGFSLVFT
ncbi:MAG: prepilin peptidase [Firmicutes bacterium]|jgi:prepilin peptidase CpaA|nr:prepilin peptidase [Bacillota bacterium]MDH7495164.1 prepilin peptidase [Bacillota bacterium]